MARPADEGPGRAERLRIVGTTDPRTFRLLGDLDLETVAELGATLEAKVGEPGDLTLDLSGLDFVDSSGIRLFIRMVGALHGTGSLLLRWPGSTVSRALALAGVAQLPHLQVIDLSSTAPSATSWRVPPIPKDSSSRPLYPIER